MQVIRIMNHRMELLQLVIFMEKKEKELTKLITIMSKLMAHLKKFKQLVYLNQG